MQEVGGSSPSISTINILNMYMRRKRYVIRVAFERSMEPFSKFWQAAMLSGIFRH